MRTLTFGLVAATAVALSATSATAQFIVHPGAGHGRGVVVSPGYGSSGWGGSQFAPQYGRSLYSPGFAQPGFGYGRSLYSPGFGGSPYGNSFYGGGNRHPSYGFGHFDYVPGHFDRHGNHYHYHPGHYHYHAPGTRAPRH